MLVRRASLFRYCCSTLVELSVRLEADEVIRRGDELTLPLSDGSLAHCTVEDILSYRRVESVGPQEEALLAVSYLDPAAIVQSEPPQQAEPESYCGFCS